MLAKNHRSVIVHSVLSLVLAAASAQAGDSSSPLESLPAVDDLAPLDGEVSPATGIASLWAEAKPTVNLRLRYEYGEQEPLDDANALTLRGRIGLMSGTYNGFSAFAEYEGTLAADRNSYQAASIHGLGRGETIIADPESHQLNRAWIQWANDSTKIKAGRQRIILNNARYIGNVGWRQNEQTFDAVTINHTTGDFAISLGTFNQTLRIFGSEDPALAGQEAFDGTSTFAHLTYAGLENAKIGAFGYFLDLPNEAGDANSNQSFGFYIDGSVPIEEDKKFTYYAEYGHQVDAFDSPLDYATDYLHVKAGAALGKRSIGLGFEHLGSDNGVGYKFPLGTNHAFNGFADKFLGTPDGGLQDIYLYAGTPLAGGVNAKLFYHLFGDDGGDFGYGQEIDAVLVKKLNDNMTVLAKGAYYDADEFGTDTTRFSLEFGYAF